MAIEVEQKFRAAHVPRLLDRLRALGATGGPIEEQVDCYYAHPARDFAATDEAVRLRRVGPHNYLTYKGPKLDTTTKTRREIELPLAAGEATADQAAQWLEALSFRRVSEVRKQRHNMQLSWQGTLVHVALDKVDGLGEFIELEVVAAADQLDAARVAVTKLAAELELTQCERRSYLELLLAAS